MNDKIKDIKIIVLDVDGTLTDGRVTYDSDGRELKAFNAKDGMAIAKGIAYGIKVAIITGRKSNIVEKRGRELGIADIYQGISNKIETLDTLLEKYNLTYENVAYMGDDINDIPAMMRANYVGITKDCVEDIKEFGDFQSQYNGGEGAVREFVEKILREKGIWKKIIEDYKNK